MFTGLVTHTGVVAAREDLDGRIRFRIEAPGLAGVLSPGDSVAVAGVCLTATDVEDDAFAVDAIRTTVSCTTLGDWGPGTEVNLEAALAAGDPLGGHLVQGHVDEVGRVAGVRAAGDERRLSVSLGESTAAVTVDRGSLAIDGVSLTVAALSENIAEFAIIPYTWSHTTLRHLGRGSRVNVEADLIGKYVRRLVEPYRIAAGAAVHRAVDSPTSQNDTDRVPNER